jgi:hypothetical protein
MANEIPERPLEVGAQVIDSVVGLVRAEAKLLWSHVRNAGSRSLTAMAFTGAALMLTPIALLILALSPVLGAWAPVELVIASGAPITIVAMLCWVLSLRSWRTAFQSATRAKQMVSAPTLGLEQHGASSRS